MKSSKNIWMTFGAIGFVLIGYIFFTQFIQQESQIESQIESHQDCGQDCIQAQLKQDAVASQVIASSKDKPQPMVEAKIPAKQDHTAKAHGDAKLGLSNKKLTQQQTAKKTYDDNWCSARHELNENDYHFAKAEYNDWLITIGKARAGSSRMSRFDEGAYPLIEPYESLPIEQLEALALQGDKWAMVTFVQKDSGSEALKDEIAKKLMVNGTSHYALVHFVLKYLLEAQVSADKKDNFETAKGYVTDALAYAYWGLENYNDGGFEAFLAVAFSERVKAQIPIDDILVNAVDEVNEKIAQLNYWVKEQRVAQGIEMPTPPKSVHNFFALKTAASENAFPKAFELLRGLDITNSQRVASTPCVASHLAALKKAREEY